MTQAWSGDWKSRASERAKRLGLPNVLAVFQTHPGIPFGQVVRLLRETEKPGDIAVAYNQYAAVYFDEAFQNGILRDAVMDVFVRKMREHHRGGWNQRKRNWEKQILSSSQMELPPYCIDKVSTYELPIWETLRELNPPGDWCPSDVGDPVVQELFSRIWPPEAKVERDMFVR